MLGMRAAFARPFVCTGRVVYATLPGLGVPQVSDATRTSCIRRAAALRVQAYRIGLRKLARGGAASSPVAATNVR